MNIGIDARFVGPRGTGIGMYTQKLIENLAKIDNKNHYKIFLKKENYGFLNLPNNFNKVEANVEWYSFREQLKMPSIYSGQNLDILHIPHFNVPYTYRKPFVVTIHDLIHHYFSETSATTKTFLKFRLKRLAYKKIITNAIVKSKKVIVPSNFVKHDILNSFRINPKKVVVTYEAAEEEYFHTSRKRETANRKRNKLLYVGNVYPHKNITNLLEAIRILKIQKKHPELLIVCSRDVFYKRLKEQIRLRSLTGYVKTKGYLTPGDLAEIYGKYDAYIFPSLSEGFGIPGLNAMAAKIPLAASNIPVLEEIYGGAAIYFDPINPGDIADKINIILKNQKTRSNLIKKGTEQVQKYSWQKMAEETLEVYKSSV